MCGAEVGWGRGAGLDERQLTEAVTSSAPRGRWRPDGVVEERFAGVLTKGVCTSADSLNLVVWCGNSEGATSMVAVVGGGPDCLEVLPAEGPTCGNRLSESHRYNCAVVLSPGSGTMKQV